MANTDTDDSQSLMMQNMARPVSGTYPEAVRRNSTDSPEVTYVNGLRPQKTPESYPEIVNEGSIGSPYTQSPDDSGMIAPHDFHKTSRKNFALLVALGVFLFTALALSTGLGIPLAQCRNKLNPDGYAPIPALNVTSVKKGKFCNKNGNLTRNQRYYASDTFSFDLYCAKEFRESSEAFDPFTKNRVAKGVIRDIVAIVAYSVPDCISACTSMNEIVKAGNSSSPPCQSITFVPNMQETVIGERGNCFLKNATINDLNSAYVNLDAVSAEVHRLRNER